MLLESVLGGVAATLDVRSFLICLGGGAHSAASCSQEFMLTGTGRPQIFL